MGQRGDTVSLDHLLDAEARQGYLASVRKFAGGYPEHDRTGGDVQSGCGYLPEGPSSVVGGASSQSGPRRRPGIGAAPARKWMHMTAYMISQVEVLDDAQWQRYGKIAAPSIAQYGRRYLVRRAVPEVAEGDWAPPHPEGQQNNVEAWSRVEDTMIPSRPHLGKGPGSRLPGPACPGRCRPPSRAAQAAMRFAGRT